MSWLVFAKVLPSFVGGEAPDYSPPAADIDRPPDTWRIRWKDSLIGSAANRFSPTAEGTELQSVVYCENLPLREITWDLLGAMAFLVKPFLDGMGDDVELRVGTRMKFNLGQQLTEVFTTIDFGGGGELLSVHGTVVDADELRLLVRVGSGQEAQEFERAIRLPPGALVSDTLTPRSELRDLQLGQTWNVPVYRIFPPGQHVQLLRATVERHEVIFWDGRDVETKLVVYRADPTSNVGAAREVLGREWIGPDGRILQTEVSFAGLRLRFERSTDSESETHARLLDAAAKTRRLPTGEGVR